MPAKTFLHFFLAAVLPILASTAYGNDEKVAIDPSAHRAAIRERLLELTPIGETFANVAAVLNQKFASPGRASAVEVKLVPSASDSRVLVKTIRIDLGEYLTNPLTLTLPIPLPIIADTSAVWIFDEKDLLVEIAVSKKLESEFDKD
jgi:hypothetical protein